MAAGDTVCPEFVDLDTSMLVVASSDQYGLPGSSKKNFKDYIGSSTSRKSYTTEFKLGVVEWVETHCSSVRAASKHFGVDRKLVRMWLEHKPQLSSALLQHGPNRRKLHSGRSPASSKLDHLALEFLCEQRKSGVPVKDRDLQQKALAIARDLGIESFKATSQWLRRWRHRCGVQLVSGVNEASIQISLPTTLPTAMLTPVCPGEEVVLHADMQKQQAAPPDDLPPPSGPVYVDRSSREHSYHKFCEDAHATFCDVIESLELPLGHEEVIEDESQSTSVTARAPHACRTSLRCHGYQTLLSSDYTHCASCSLLASRISVPVYPAGPEIVYVDVPNLVSSAW